MTDFDTIMREVRRTVMSMLALAGSHRRGIVTSVDDSGTYAVKVMFQPENVQSGWLPVKSHAIGAGFGLALLPNLGDQVLIAPAEDHMEQGVVIGALYSDEQRAPAAKAGEMVFLHQNGSFLKVTNDGKVSINGNVEIDMTSPKATITTTGETDIHAGSNVNVTATAQVNVTAPAIGLNGDVTVTADAGGACDIAATTLTANISGTATINAATINLN